MTNVDPTVDAVERMTDPDPFSLVTRLRDRLKSCCKDEGKPTTEDLVYLWLHVTTGGIGQPADGDSPATHLSLENWLNIVDEAASLGATWLVITLNTNFSAYPDVWTICQWAQDTHGMKVGLHTNVLSLDPEEIDAIKQLDLTKVRLLVTKQAMETMQSLEKEGIRLWAANPQESGEKPQCQGPAKMVFVDPDGVLYTCGLVEGKEEYRLGHAFSDRFENVIHNPQLPHSVSDSIHKISSGCDGCPSLVANFFSAEEEA